MLFSLVLTLFSFPQVDRSGADRWFAQARAHFEKRELDESRAAAEKALQIDPQIADAEVLLGLIANLQAQPQNAEKHLKRAVGLEPSNHQAHSYLAGVYLEQKRLAEAESGYQTVLKLNPGNSVASYNLGLIALMRGQPDRALANFNKVYQSNPKDASALLGLLETQLLLKQSSEARQSATAMNGLLAVDDPRLFQAATLLAIHREYSTAIPILERLRQNIPQSFDVHYNLALAYARTGKNSEAAQVLQSLPSLTKRAEGLNLLGQVVEKDRPQAALEAYSKAAALEPLNEQFRFDYGNQLLQQELIDKAREAFRQGCLDFPRSWKMHVGLGAGQYLSGQYEESAQALLQAVRIAPDTSVPYFLLGKTYPLVTSSREAIRNAFDHYLQHPRTDAWAYFHSGTMMFLDLQSQPQADFEPVVRQLRRALNLSPKFPEASLQLGIVLQAQAKHNESVRLFEQVVASAPEMPSARYRLAQAYQRLGMKEKAQAEFMAYERLKNQAKSGQEVRSILQTVGR